MNWEFSPLTFSKIAYPAGTVNFARGIKIDAFNAVKMYDRDMPKTVLSHWNGCVIILIIVKKEKSSLFSSILF